MKQSTDRSNGARSAKWHQRRLEVVDTSAKAMAQRGGYHATGTADLCEANDLAKGALYYYIGSKQQLLVAIQDRFMDEVMLGADRVRRAGGSPPEQLRMLGEALTEVMVRFPDHLWVLLHDYPALTGKHAEQFRKRRREYERRVEEVFEAGMKSGHFRKLDAAHAAHAWISTKMQLWLMADEGRAARKVSGTFEDIFVRGISRGE